MPSLLRLRRRACSSSPSLSLPSSFAVGICDGATLCVASRANNAGRGWRWPTGSAKWRLAFAGRCSRPAEHGDHFYPWSKGGATSLQNFVAACSRCNRAKGAQIPSPSQQKRLERRRLGYVNARELVRVGERRGLPSVFKNLS
ncbi:HNH endonuclease signature motif containing protein [Arthrobacter methylotrophus]|uniref:HNH endonuclease signature motif containing protein n=1 Tax=Arthrobacter methylotrophus TaxID=121291 RepID=A0ABV5UQJ8_9MICC